jgi:hypothetical protein
VALMNARVHTWTRGLLAAGLALSLGSCGYIEDLIEDTASNSPGDISGFDDSDVATYGKVATEMGLIDGITSGFGSGAADLAKAGARGAVGPFSDCPIFTLDNIDTYPTGPFPDKLNITYDYTNSTSPCNDTNGNPLSGMYTVKMTSASDETWPAASADAGDFDNWTFDGDGASLLYHFMDMSAVLAGPGITTTSNGKMNVDVDTTTEHATNVGDIRTTLDDGSVVLSAVLSKVDLTKTLGATDSTSGTFRLAVTLFGYVDVTLTNVVVDDGTCPNHPVSGTVDLVGENDDMVSLDFGTGTCNTADVTTADGTVFPDTVIQPIF